MRLTKRIYAVIALSLVLVLAMMSVGCLSANSGSDKPSETAEKPSDSGETSLETGDTLYKVAMVTDVGGINDQGFNQSAWQGMEKMQADGWAKVKYIESKQEADYTTNLDALSDEGNDMIWGIGYMMADALLNAAKVNPNNMYGIVDNSYGDDTPSNVVGLVFSAQECSFQVGYIAAKMTKTNKVGIVGGIKGAIIDQFEYGYRAGVAYGAKELGKEITVEVQYADSFTDAAKGKTIATSMYQNGCDIVFQAAGNVGQGVIEAAKEFDKWAIGADTDQNYLAPDNVITSAMKLVGEGMYKVTQRIKDGEALGGTTVVGTLADGSVGIAPTSDKLCPRDVLDDTQKVTDDIISGKIVPPYDEETFKEYIAGLE